MSVHNRPEPMPADAFVATLQMSKHVRLDRGLWEAWSEARVFLRCLPTLSVSNMAVPEQRSSAIDTSQ
jgi:hypothetical protein